MTLLCLRYAWIVLGGMVVTSWLVEASPDGLRIISVLGSRRKVVEIHADSIEELSLPPFSGFWSILPAAFLKPIVVRSDGGTVSFGSHLPFGEKLWIALRIRRVLGIDPPGQDGI